MKGFDMQYRRSLCALWLFIFGFYIAAMGLGGCAHDAKTGRFRGRAKEYPIPEIEAAWIRNGEPIEFEGTLWYPTDNIEILLDEEVYMTGEYRGVLFFFDKTDVRPYRGVYTKFGRNRFRLFEKRSDE